MKGCLVHRETVSFTSWDVVRSRFGFFDSRSFQNTIEGFDSSDAIGNMSKIFLYLCGFLGNYSAFSQSLYVLNLMVIAPRTPYMFHFKSGSEVPIYSYTTKMHPGNQSYTSVLAHNVELGSAVFVKTDTDLLGMKKGKSRVRRSQ